jgi:predicted nucleic acid-binding protein
MNLVCVDSHLLIWGIKSEATLGQEKMIPIAKGFIKHLNDEHTKVMIPSIVVAEFLLKIPPTAFQTITNLIDMNFMVVSFDAKAACKFAEIWQQRFNEVKHSLTEPKTRDALKADSMIVATAVANNAQCLYSHDEGVKSFAKGYIPVEEIPFIATQPNAFAGAPVDTDWGKATKKFNEN